MTRSATTRTRMCVFTAHNVNNKDKWIKQFRWNAFISWLDFRNVLQIMIYILNNRMQKKPKKNGNKRFRQTTKSVAALSSLSSPRFVLVFQRQKKMTQLNQWILRNCARHTSPKSRAISDGLFSTSNTPCRSHRSHCTDDGTCVHNYKCPFWSPSPLMVPNVAVTSCSAN